MSGSSILLGYGLSALTFTLTRLYLPAGVIWTFSRYVIKAPPLAIGAEVVIALTTLGLLSPLIGTFLGLNLLLRLILSIYLRISTGGKIFLMGGRDAFVSHDEHANSCNHYSLYVIQGTADLAKIRRKFTRILQEQGPDGRVVYDRLKRKLVRQLGYYCWEHVGSTFKIEDHVKYLIPPPPTIPSSGGEPAPPPLTYSLSESQVFEEMQKIYDHPFGGDKPPWEILLIPHFTYDNNNSDNASTPVVTTTPTTNFSAEFEARLHVPHYAFLVRMHHGIMDGISAGNALQHYMADAPMKLTVDPLSPEHSWSWGRTLAAYTQLLLMGPRSFFKVLFLDESNCFHGPQLTGPKTLSWSRQVRVEALRQVKEWSKTSVTAVLVSALGGGVRNLALKKGLPVPTQVHAFPTIGILPFPDIKPRNRFTMALLPLCIGLDTSVERLKSAEGSLKALLRSPDVLTNYHLMAVFGKFPVRVINFFLEKCHATLLLSNVPGPAEKATIFGGDQIVDIGIWAPIQLGIGIGMSLFSYGGAVRATVVLDKTAGDAEDVPTIIEEFEKEVAQLAKGAGVPLDQVFCETNNDNDSMR